MRPIKLTMSAFGSYSGMETIDFTKIQGGLFLVTGDTGAGKTTIFDAVTYALYDRTSGGRRDGNMMRSQYADDEAETFVEYTFAYRDGQYTIRRNPEYMRAGKRKNADGKIRLVKETSKVSLIMPDGKEFQGKKREVDQKIEQIIGLDAGQFTQIAMIAQGDFLRLLHAESKERKKIFSKIFQTQIYRDVQEQLKEQGKALYIQLKENEADIRREMERRCRRIEGAKGVGRFDFPGNALGRGCNRNARPDIKRRKRSVRNDGSRRNGASERIGAAPSYDREERGDQQDLRSVRANRIGI